MNATACAVARRASALILALAVISCSAADTPAWADEDTGEATPATAPADFTDRDTGLYPDVQENAKYQNSGNRGCVACHDDLFQVDKDNGTYTHITTYVGMKQGRYSADCKTCHSINIGTTGNVMSENIHVAHYSSAAFVEANGNCWSCHSIVKNADGTVEMQLFEDVQYESTYGGYFNANESDATVKWTKDRGFETGYMSGVSVEAKPAVDVTLDQEPNAEEDEFLILNYQRIDREDAYADIDPQTWTLEITGVNEPRTFTLDDLKALPQTEATVAQWCAVNGINGAMADNMPVSGVLLADLIEACGGLTDDANAMYFTCADGWYPSSEGTTVQNLIDSNAMICLGNYGHDLTVTQGGPAKLLIPAAVGAISAKNLTQISFEHSDEPVILGSDAGLYPINSSWFVNDGVEATAGQTVSIEGAAYGFCSSELDMHPVQVKFSLDYGKTWVTYDVPEDFDPQQWVHFTFNWTPAEAGTYIAKVVAVGADGSEQPTASSLIVTVSE